MKAKKIPLRQRMSFLPNLFSSYFLSGESFVFGFMDKYARGYNGAHYDFIKVENGAMYLQPDGEYFLSLPNYFNESISGDICGIIATLYALNAMIHKAHVKEHDSALHFLIKKYNELNDYVRTMDDASYSLIKRAID